MLTRSSENIRDRSREAAKEIRRFIEEGIASRSLHPGDKLPNERDLAVTYGIGRNTVRKILVELEQEGKIERSVGRGTFVRTRSGPAGGATSEAALATAVSRSASPLDLMEFRLAIEPSITEHAVQRATSADIERMQAAIDRSRRAKSLQEFEDCDDELHRAIAVASRNSLYLTAAEIITAVRAQAEWGTLKKRTLTEDLRKLHTTEHVQIVDAIRRRDGRAAREAMALHLVNVRKMMFPH